MPCNSVSRCCEPIADEHLHRLAQPVFEGLFGRRPDTSGRYRGRLPLLALCQGAAQHWVDGRHGVKDLDVWEFFRPHPGGRFPVRWRKTCDFGPSALGRHPDDAGYTRRRVDMLGRSIEVEAGEDGTGAIRSYLAGAQTRTAWHLAQRPVIALHPGPLFGLQVWPSRP